MIEVKILSCRAAQRYSVRQRVVAAKRDLLEENPGLDLVIKGVKDWAHIEAYTQNLAAPSLVVNEKLVCEGRFPTRQEILDWLRSEINDHSS